MAGMCLAGSDPTPDQKAPPSSPPIEREIHEHVEVRLVLIEVVAVDSKGEHVFGLRKEDLEVREDGLPVVIETFDEIGKASDPSGHAVIAHADSPPSVSASASAQGRTEARTSGEEPRRFVFLFDGYNNPSLLRMNQARRAATKFVRERLRPDDQAAVFEISPFLTTVEFFSGDPLVFERAIQRVRFFPSESMAKEIRDAHLEFGNIGSRQDVAERLVRMSDFGASQATQERRQFYRSVEDLGRVLTEYPGRKFVLLFSGGFPLLPSKEEAANLGLTAEFKGMVTELARARTTVYSANIGEDRDLADVETRVGATQALEDLGLGSDFLDRIGLGAGGESTSAYTAILSVIANESGGSFFGGRDYGKFLRRIEGETRHFYLLGYVPPDSRTGGSGDKPRAEDDRYRTIDVKCKRKGVTVRSRRGRFPQTLWVDRPGAQANTATPPPTVGARVQEATAMPTVARPPEPKPSTPFLTCTPIVFAGENGVATVSVLLELHAGIRPVVLPEEGMVLDLSVRLSAGAGGEEISGREDSFRVKATSDKIEEVRDGIRITEGLVLRSGAYDLAVTVRMNGLGIEASCSRTLAVPDFPDGKLGLSDITVQGKGNPLPLVASYFSTESSSDKAAIRPPDPHRLASGWRIEDVGTVALDRAEGVILFYRVYHPAVDPATGLPRELAVDYALRPETGGESIYPPVEIVQFRRADPEVFDVVVRLDTAGLAPGPYRLTVAARDLAASTSTFRDRTLNLH